MCNGEVALRAGGLLRDTMVDASHPSLLKAMAARADASLPPGCGVCNDKPLREDGITPCLQCKRRKKCRSGQRCANYENCKRILVHGHIYGGDGTIGSGIYCNSSECKGLAGVPINGAIAKRRLYAAKKTSDKPAQSAKPPPTQPPPSQPSPSQQQASQQQQQQAPSQPDCECDDGFLDGLVNIEVKVVLSLRSCKDLTTLTALQPNELLGFGAGKPGYERAFLILADFFYEGGKASVVNALKWVPEAVLSELNCGPDSMHVDVLSKTSRAYRIFLSYPE